MNIIKKIVTFICIVPVVLFFIPIPFAVPIAIAGTCYEEHNWWPLAIYLVWVCAGLIGMRFDDRIKWMQ
jgi:hypothetical protein